MNDFNKMKELIVLIESVSKGNTEDLLEARHDDLYNDVYNSLSSQVINSEYKDEYIRELEATNNQFKQMIVSSDFRSFPNSWKMFFAEMFGAAMSGTIYRMAKNNSDDAINIRKIEQKANRLKRKSKTLDKMFNGSLQILRSIFSECVVYLHTKYPPIENLSPYEVDDFLAALAKLNNDYETVNEELVEPTGDEELLIDMGQYKWFNLNTNICSLEADAMGHCGNRYAKSGDEILSLRQVVKVAGEIYHRPSLTFIINDGLLGEMKGRANKKPDKKIPQVYHRIA